MAGKLLFCKLDSSQAYHCLHMADQRSAGMLASNFASRSSECKRVAQGLSRSVAAFSSSMREYLDPVVKADQCAQYVDDIESKPIMLRILPGTVGQSSSAFAKLDWN